MLEYFFSLSWQLERLHHPPLCKHLDGLAAKLKRSGFTRASGQRILSMTNKFNRFALSIGVESVEKIDEALIHRFISQELASQGVFRDGTSLMHHLLEYLRDQGIIPNTATDNADGPADPILDAYERYLHNVRGLTMQSCSSYLRCAHRFLGWLDNRHRRRPPTGLTGADVMGYITDMVGLHPSGAWRNTLCSLTRAFLRWLRQEGIIEIDLDRVVPRAPCRRLSSLPRHLPWDRVQELIGSVDTSDAGGLRDRAVLLIMAALGLRNEEVRRLEFGHIAWRAAQIRVTETKSRRERVLPLPQEVGSAIANYVMHGRPRLQLPYVFLRHRPPQGPLTSTDGIGGIVRRHLQHAGIKAPSLGAHLLRHSLATRMVNQRVPIKQIADMLGHASINTTAIYTKVDMANLASVALPFPGNDV